MLEYSAFINECLKGEKTVYILKGFSGLDFNNLNLPFLTDINYIDAFENNSDLTKFRQEMISKIGQKFSGNESYVIFYEQFALLGSQLTNLFSLYGYDTVIIRNNLFKIYYPVGFELTERMQKEIEDESPKYYLIQDCYSEYTVANGVKFIQYTDSDSKAPINTIELFSNPQEFEPHIDDNTTLTVDYYVDDNDDNFSSIVYDIIHSDKSRFVLNSKEKLTYFELSVLGCLTQIGYDFVIVRKAVYLPKEDYSAYLEILHRRNAEWGFKTFKIYKSPGFSLETEEVSQGDIINAIVKSAIDANENNNYYDVFVTAPTGAGKSLIFQIPAIYLAEQKQYVTIIISPLIGLMNDQVYNIKDLTSEAATINSDYTPEQKEKIKGKMRSGELSILYLSPEALISISDIKDIVGDRKIGLFVVDEAHIVATWGKSFRPDYWYLGDYIARLRNKLGYRFPIATFSATITFGGVDDMHIDIINSLHMRTGPNEFIGPVKRENIGFDIRIHKKENDYREEKHQIVLDSLSKLSESGHKTLAYFPFVSLLRDISSDAAKKHYKWSSYFGSEKKELKDRAMDEFRSGETNTMLCTKAFGMGIDIDDIDTVYHYAPTGNLCDYVQEIGRCARDKSIHGTAITDYFDEDFRYINQLYGISAITNYQVIATLRKIRDTYYAKKSRNFVISPDDFSYIFAEKTDMSHVDAQLKTTLLMIQKDFERDPVINFQPIIFKPRSLFTRGYVMILDSDLEKFKNNKYFKYLRLFKSKDQMASKGIQKDTRHWFDYKTATTKTSTNNVHVNVTYQGDIYSIDFKDMWEKEFNDLTFAEFKWKLFNGELEGFEIGEKLKPEYLLHVQSENQNFRQIIDKIERYLNEIRNDFAKIRGKNSVYTIKDITRIIANATDGNLTEVESEIAATNYINIMNAYDSSRSFTTATVFKHRENYDDYNLSYALLDRKTQSIIRDMKSRFSNVMDFKDKTFLVNLGKSSNNQSKLIMSKKEFNIAQLLEIFKLATYEVTSGERPEYFMRINSIRAIERILAQPNYKSEMVKLSGDRHNDSVKVMKTFFTKLNTDDERWDFIEKYFVGIEDQEKEN